MAWQNLCLQLGRSDADAFGDALLEQGAISVNVEDADEGTAAEAPIFGEPGAATGLWNQCRLSALFSADADIAQALALAATQLGLPLPPASVEPLEDEDWVRRNRDQFQPIRISERVWIVPTWHQAPDADAINIVLDPGAAFGTGSHPTTRLCLLWLEAHTAQLNGASVLDYGCGSGILGIAARRLGAGQTIGIDIDETAVEAARANAAQNATQIDFATPQSALTLVADVTVANILANPLVVLAPLLAQHTRVGGHIVLSGILNPQADDVIAAYRPWFDLEVWRQEEGWSALAGVRVPDREANEKRNSCC